LALRASPRRGRLRELVSGPAASRPWSLRRHLHRVQHRLIPVKRNTKILDDTRVEAVVSTQSHLTRETAFSGPPRHGVGRHSEHPGNRRAGQVDASGLVRAGMPRVTHSWSVDGGLALFQWIQRFGFLVRLHHARPPGSSPSVRFWTPKPLEKRRLRRRTWKTSRGASPRQSHTVIR